MTYAPPAPRASLDDLVTTVLRDVDVLSNPYLVALRDGSFGLDDFVETQAQFAFVVSFFPRAMAAVAARVQEPALRLEVLRNVWEEHGEGDLSRSHVATIRELLRRLAGDRAEGLARRPLWPEARLFDTALAGAATLDESIVGVGMLAMIERTFVDVSGCIGRALVARGWLAPGQVVHYDVHEVLDVRHSEDLLRVLRPRWEADPGCRYYVEQGLRLGAAALDGLYRGLYSARGRRWTVAGPGPHART